MTHPRRTRRHGRSGGLRARPQATGGSHRRRRQAFTLIELLVVLAILLLLLAILSPSTKYAYQTSQKITCQTNLHQIGAAALQFENDKKRLVKIKPGSNKSFSDKLMPYLSTHEFFFCPSEEKRPTAARNNERLDYGINHYGRGDPKHGGKKKFYDSMGYHPETSNKNSPNHSNRVGDSGVIYFSDADTDQSPEDIGGISRGTDEWPIQHSFQKYAYKRHLGGYNCSRLDASATWYPKDPPTNEKWFIPKY